MKEGCNFPISASRDAQSWGRGAATLLSVLLPLPKNNFVEPACANVWWEVLSFGLLFSKQRGSGLRTLTLCSRVIHLQGGMVSNG